MTNWHLKLGINKIRHDVAVRFLACINHFNDPVHSPAQIFMFHPAKGVSRTHQKTSCLGTWQVLHPLPAQRFVKRLDLLPCSNPEIPGQLIECEGRHQIGYVVFQGCFENSFFQRNTLPGNRLFILIIFTLHHLPDCFKMTVSVLNIRKKITPFNPFIP